MDLVALPPDCAQSGLAAGSGRFSGRAVTAGSTTTSPSPVRTAMRWPKTGVLGPFGFFKMPQLPAARAAAQRRETRKSFAVIISVLLSRGRDGGANVGAERSGKLACPAAKRIRHTLVLGDGNEHLPSLLFPALLEHRKRCHFTCASEPGFTGLGQ